MGSLVTLITTEETSTSRSGNDCRAMGWQFYTDILQGVDTPGCTPPKPISPSPTLQIGGVFYIDVDKGSLINKQIEKKNEK